MIFVPILGSLIAQPGLASPFCEAPTYPPTRRVDQVDTLHGVQIEDPYRWLEADIRTSGEVADWVAKQSKVTTTYLNDIPERSSIARRKAESGLTSEP